MCFCDAVGYRMTMTFGFYIKKNVCKYMQSNVRIFIINNNFQISITLPIIIIIIIYCP